MGDAEENEKRVYKNVLLGGEKAGKSCLLYRLLDNPNQFGYGDPFIKYDPTIEDSYRKDNFLVGRAYISIEILDTAGQVIALQS